MYDPIYDMPIRSADIDFAQHVRIRSPGRRALRAQLEATHRRIVRHKGGWVRATDPVAYSQLGGQLTRVDRHSRGMKVFGPGGL
jgi:hypothetical protein